MSKQDKNKTPNPLEAKIFDLERDYFKELERIFKLPQFKNDMLNMALWITTNHNYIQQHYSAKSNKIDVATQRLINYSVMKHLKNIVGVYASPISSDIAYETTDSIILIDSKTNSEVGNKNDFYEDFHYGPNQASFKHDNAMKNIPPGFPGVPVPCNLPSIDLKSNKPVLTFFLITSYYDKNQSFYWSKSNPNIRLICVPNGKISRFFDNNITSNAKDYSYVQHQVNGKTVQKKRTKNTTFSSQAIKISTGIGSGCSKGYYLPSTNETWLYSARSKPPSYKQVKSFHERRTLIDTIDERYDSKGKLWHGHSCWKI
jgi:hypothetical protein